MIVTLLLIASACRRAPRKPTLEESAKEINALVPAKWQGKIEFVPGTITWKDWRYTMLVPKGWREADGGGAVEAPDNNVVDFSPVFGFNNEVRMSTQCGGECGPVRDWATASEAQMFHQFLTGLVRGSVLSDEKSPNGRLLIYQRAPEKGYDVKLVPGDKARLVVRAWWNPKDAQYHICQATLSDVSYELAPVMAAACMTATAERIKPPAS